MTLVEYLYVDQRRLDAYFQQISSSHKLQKIPVWKAEIGLLGPKVVAEQGQVAGSFTTHDKVRRLVDYLWSKGLLDPERPSATDYSREFRLETCLATRLLLPPSPGAPQGFLGLSLWISDSPESQPDADWLKLYLLEDYSGPDGYYQGSALSILNWMYEAWTHEFYDTVVHVALSQQAPGAHFNARLEHRMASDPVGFMTVLGARIGLSRRITVLYRVRTYIQRKSPLREVLLESHKLGAPLRHAGTIGYPIFIAAPTLVFGGDQLGHS